ncbi:hypothetical protein ACFW1A_32110 [Kitasatospora sp. NPDC058965]|uniref:hypothetical protein n=1 Tax=Kitasatospora sp. NPDC058965 TaxID=3346682 RepID=UPI0036ACD684
MISVPAARLAGRQRLTAWFPAHGDTAGHILTRETVSPLAAALAYAPEQRQIPLKALGVLGLLVSAGTFAVGALSGDWFADRPAIAAPTDASFWTTGPDGHPEYVLDHTGVLSGHLLPSAPAATGPGNPYLGWICVIALLAGFLLLVAHASRRTITTRMLAGRPAAERLRSQAWYCRRCATVHLPATAPGGASGPLSLAEFRTLVWEAGGYGHLVRHHPVH